MLANGIAYLEHVVESPGHVQGLAVVPRLSCISANEVQPRHQWWLFYYLNCLAQPRNASAGTSCVKRLPSATSLEWVKGSEEPDSSPIR